MVASLATLRTESVNYMLTIDSTQVPSLLTQNHVIIDQLIRFNLFFCRSSLLSHYAFMEDGEMKKKVTLMMSYHYAKYR